MAAPKHKDNHPSQEHEHENLPDIHVHTFLEWNAPGRPFIKHSKQYFLNALLITTALEIILFLFSEYALMMVALALVFLALALAWIPPRMFHYRITSEGVLVEDHFFIWEELYDFYIWDEHGEEVLHIGTKGFPGEILLTLGHEMSVDKIKKVLLPYLPFREYVKPSFIDKAGSWLEHNFPLEKPQ